VLGVKATEGFLRAMVRDENNARFATLTVTIGECRAEARRYIKTLKAKADPSRSGARDDSNSTIRRYEGFLAALGMTTRGKGLSILGTPTRTRTKAENNMGINKNAGLIGRRF